MKHDMRYAMCPMCNKIATIDHILLNCIITKKIQMNKHDRIGEYILRSLKIKYKLYENKEKMKKREEENTKKLIIRKEELRKNERRIEKDKILIVWNQEIVNRSDGKFHKKPDIYVRYLNKKKAMIIDMRIVRDKNISKAFTDKINMYSKLHEHIRKI